MANLNEYLILAKLLEMEEESEKYTNYLWVEDWFLRCQHILGHQTPGFGDDKWNRIINNMLYERAITLHDGNCEIAHHVLTCQVKNAVEDVTRQFDSNSTNLQL